MKFNSREMTTVAQLTQHFGGCFQPTFLAS